MKNIESWVCAIVLAVIVIVSWLAFPDCGDGTLVRGLFWFECMKG